MTQATPTTESTYGELGDDIGFLLSIARAITTRRVNDELEPTGLRGRSYSVLALAAGSDGVTQREIADMLNLNPSQIVPLVDELASRSLVERRAHASDRRARLVAATPEGRDLYLDARSRVSDAVSTVLSGLDGAERELLHDLLRRVIDTTHER
jgi:DNA-binding MarR family transcriptional regulator